MSISYIEAVRCRVADLPDDSCLICLSAPREIRFRRKDEDPRLRCGHAIYCANCTVKAADGDTVICGVCKAVATELEWAGIETPPPIRRMATKPMPPLPGTQAYTVPQFLMAHARSAHGHAAETAKAKLRSIHGQITDVLIAASTGNVPLGVDMATQALLVACEYGYNQVSCPTLSPAPTFPSYTPS